MSSDANQKQNVYLIISGQENGERIESRVLEEKIQEAVASGERNLKILASGQHGIGGRLWKAGEEKVHIRIEGPPGQRLGSLGFDNTTIEVHGPASDDTGWLNAGAEIIVHGQVAMTLATVLSLGFPSDLSPFILAAQEAKASGPPISKTRTHFIFNTIAFNQGSAD